MRTWRPPGTCMRFEYQLPSRVSRSTGSSPGRTRRAGRSAGSPPPKNPFLAGSCVRRRCAGRRRGVLGLALRGRHGCRLRPRLAGLALRPVLTGALLLAGVPVAGHGQNLRNRTPTGPSGSGSAAAHWRCAQAYRAMPDATPALKRPGGAVLGDRAHRRCTRRPSAADRPGPSWPKTRTHRLGQRLRSRWRTLPGRLSMPDDREPVLRRPRGERIHGGVVVHRQVAVGGHRTAAVPAPPAHHVDAGDVEGVGVADHRPDVEVVAPVLHGDVDRQPAAVEVGHDRLLAPVAVAVDHVAAIARPPAARVEAGVVGPGFAGAGPAPDRPAARGLGVERDGRSRR